MHPYLPFAALPVAALVAWFGASHGSIGQPGRYQVPRVAPIDDPSALMGTRAEPAGKPDIRVTAFLPVAPAVPPAPEPTLVLHSVMTGKDARLATVNGRVVREGDRVEGYLVRRISAEGVELERGERTRRLPMRPLHELPPPALAGALAEKRTLTARRDGTDLTEDFWKIFDSLKLQP